VVDQKRDYEVTMLLLQSRKASHPSHLREGGTAVTAVKPCLKVTGWLLLYFQSGKQRRWNTHIVLPVIDPSGNLVSR